VVASAPLAQLTDCTQIENLEPLGLLETAAELIRAIDRGQIKEGASEARDRDAVDHGAVPQ